MGNFSIDFNRLAAEVWAEKPFAFDYRVVDEAQDLSTAKARIRAGLAGGTPIQVVMPQSH